MIDWAAWAFIFIQSELSVVPFSNRRSALLDYCWGIIILSVFLSWRTRQKLLIQSSLTEARREKTAYYEMRVCVPVWTCCYRQQKCEAVGWCSQTFAGLLDIPQQLTLQKIKLVFSVLPLLSYQTSIETCASARPRRLSMSRDVHTASVFFALGGFDSKSAG